MRADESSGQDGGGLFIRTQSFLQMFHSNILPIQEDQVWFACKGVKWSVDLIMEGVLCRLMIRFMLIKECLSFGRTTTKYGLQISI